MAGNPVTITLDAPHNYTEAYDYTNYLHPLFDNLEDEDHDVWKERTKPKAPITFGITTNPRTGKINWKPSGFLGIITGMGAGRNGHIDMLEAQNPYNEGFSMLILLKQRLLLVKMMMEIRFINNLQKQFLLHGLEWKLIHSQSQRE